MPMMSTWTPNPRPASLAAHLRRGRLRCVAVNLTGFGNVITNSVRATVRDNSNLDADGWVSLEAGDDSSIRSAGVSIAGSTVAVGALIGANVITNSVLARISGSRVKSGLRRFQLHDDTGRILTMTDLGLRMHAENSSEIMGFSGGLAIGGGAGHISLSANVDHQQDRSSH